MRRVLALLLALILPPAINFPTWKANYDAELERSDVELSQLEVRIEHAHAAQRTLTQFHEELAKLEQELVKLREILPPELAVGEILALSEASAQREGARLTKFTASPLKATPPLQQQSIEVEVVGTVEATTRFLRDLQNASRVIDVSSVTLRKDPAGWRTAFILTCYALPDERGSHDESEAPHASLVAGVWARGCFPRASRASSEGPGCAAGARNPHLGAAQPPGPSLDARDDKACCWRRTSTPLRSPSPAPSLRV